MIKNSVSAELVTHNYLEGNSKALTTVTIAVDGIGSIGSAVTPLLAGLVANSRWNNAFNMLVCAATPKIIWKRNDTHKTKKFTN